MPIGGDFLVIGSGIAGLRAAMSLAEAGRVVVLTKADPRESNTGYAQGGIAAAVGPDDSPQLHASDTMAAGDGLCVPDAVRALTEEGPRYVRELIDWGAAFDRDQTASRRSAAKPRTRCAACCTRATPPAARSAACCGRRWRRTRSVTVYDDALVMSLVTRDGECVGATFVGRDGALQQIDATRTLIATGGAGQVFRETTNPAIATGDGIAMAFDAGARVADLEFVQFHPTVLSVEGAPRFLLSEALRGEGARLVNEAGEPFMTRYEPAGDLASRDLVARAIVKEVARTGAPVYLSMAHLDPEFVRRRFPTIAQRVPRGRIRPGQRPGSRQPRGALRHGRRRDRPARAHVGRATVRRRRGRVHRRSRRQPAGQQLAARGTRVRRARGGGDAWIDACRRRSRATLGEPIADAPAADASAAGGVVPDPAVIRDLMWRHAGLVRAAEGLRAAVPQLAAWRVAAAAQACRGAG